VTSSVFIRQRDPAFLEERWQIREGIKLLYVAGFQGKEPACWRGFRALSEWPVT